MFAHPAHKFFAGIEECNGRNDGSTEHPLVQCSHDIFALSESHKENSDGGSDD